jgi:peroxiredoxin
MRAMSGYLSPRPLLAGLMLVISLAATMAGAGQKLQPFRGTPVAPEISLSDLDGKTVTLAEFRGKVVIVNFWATWCPPCRKEMPSMQRAWQQLQANDVMLLAVHVGGNTDQIWEFASEFSLAFPILIDGSSRVSRSWPMRGLPTTFVIDPQGRIAYMALGGREWDDPELLQTIYALKN